ncbi:hypothetical protein HX746_30845 (plasmid) [Rhodococcus erythropolis]|uniref:hypothetical protein n=1 Tax=Rhodococcus erythropolis TaxID=1833 RepID=UPI001ADC967E|nr:hypothetical protein [Rhodococcus erythropolis]MBO8150684.1 hypothetical protein [Rhodococcus erythropolis]
MDGRPGRGDTIDRTDEKGRKNPQPCNMTGAKAPEDSEDSRWDLEIASEHLALSSSPGRHW